MSRLLLVCTSPGEQRVALLQDDVLEAYALWRPGAPDEVGALHVGRVTAVAPAMAGAFVALHDGVGFLPDSSAGGGGVGDHLLVRVTRAAQGGKGPRLAAVGEAEAPARLITPAPEAALRLALEHPAAEVLAADAALVGRLRPILGERVRLVGAAVIEADPVWEEVAALGEAVVSLPGGLRASVSPTPALVAIDVDMAAASGARQDKASAQLAANRAALPALARAIRLRNLSGAILVDFAGMPSRRRAALGPALQAALAADPLQPRLLGFTALGLAEIVRARVRPPLHELLAGPHAAGLAGLRQLARLVPRRGVLVAAPAIVAALERDAAAAAAFRQVTGAALLLQAAPELAPGQWRIDAR